MRRYPVDIDPEQIVRWVMAERGATPLSFNAVSKRSTETRDIPMRQEYHLGDEEREELSEIATVASLEIAPVHASDGWRLTVVVEDEGGPRVPEEDAADEGEEEIDLETFYAEFIRPGRGSANVVAEVEDSSAERRLADLISAIEKNRHGSEPRGPARAG